MTEEREADDEEFYVEQDMPVEVRKLEGLKDYLYGFQVQIPEKEEDLKSLKEAEARLRYLVSRVHPVWPNEL